MQEIIVFILAGGALVYLAFKFLGKKTDNHCDSCSYSSEQETKKQ
jgi:hypothetical protein